MREIKIPKMGMTTTEVDLMRWLVEVGDIVGVGTPLAEVESEKASAVLESDVQGTVVELVAKEGGMVEVGAVLCRIDQGG